MSQKVYLTEEGYAKLVKELEELREEQKKNIIEIQDARAQGDLSENADYDIARDKQARIAAQIKEKEQSLKSAVIIKGDEGNNLGKFVEVYFVEEDVTETYQIVGTIEADPLKEKISDESPLGKAIIHATVGQTVLVKTEDGEKFEVRIENVYSPEPEKSTKKTTKKK